MLAALWLLTGCPTTDKSSDDSSDPVGCNAENQACAPDTCAGSDETMLPGSDCLACHSAGVTSGGVQPTVFGAAGTAFSDAYGKAPLAGATIEITDANDQIVDLTTNAVGNYYTTLAIVPPIHGAITTPGGHIAMPDPQDTTSCNVCHACGGQAGGRLYGHP